jgi:hypothetical protein
MALGRFGKKLDIGHIMRKKNLITDKQCKKLDIGHMRRKKLDF